MAAKTKAKTKSSSTKKRPITPEDLLKFHLLANPQISPNGKSIVFVKKHVGDKNNFVSNLWIVDTDGKSQPRQFTSGEKDSHPRWCPSGGCVAFISGRDKPKPQIYTINASGGEAVALTTFGEGSLGTFKWSPDGSMLAISFRIQDPQWTSDAEKERKEKGLSDPPRVLDHYWYRLDGDGYFNAQRHELYLYDFNAAKVRKIYSKDALGFFSFDFSPDSKKLVIGTNTDKRALLKPWNDDLVVLNIASGKTRKIANLPRGPKDAVSWSPDGKWIAYAGRIGEESTYSVENLELFVCDAKTGKAKSLTAKEDYCLMAVALTDTAEVSFGPIFNWSQDSKRIYMKLGWQGESHLASVAVKGGKIAFLTKGAVDQDMGNISGDGKLIAMTTANATNLAEIYVGKTGTSITTIQLTNFNKELLKKTRIASITSHWIKTDDGTKLQVWIMKPPNFKANKKYPTVLQIHGGPHAQYGVGFFHEFQVLAAAGYVVFFSNPRGSKGYGRDHTAAIKGNWGSADWVDIQAVMKFMQAQKFVNAKRMGIMGGSYGGYMTNWAIGHTNDFAGAITDRCVSNLVSMGGSSDFIDRPDDYFPGNTWDRPEARWNQSPLKYFGNVKTPTLIIHSEGDLRCNVEQAEQIHAALSIRNIPTRFVRYPRSTFHGLSRSGPPDLRIHRLHQILDWWKRYL
ncbi:MAG: S9 family peptidase [Planctomycetes bacterium]|nr:S9 family peptidase [Planctomycetota bacterium]